MTLALVMAGAAVGAPLRWWLDRFIQARHDTTFPWGTFTINMLGSLLLGVLLGAATGDGPWVALLGTGFCGGFTTFSTFGYETVRLTQEGSNLTAVLNVVASLGVGLVAATGGWYLASAVFG